MQWVNAGYFGSNGWGSGADYLASDLLARLADPSHTHRAAPAGVRAVPHPDYAIEDPASEPQIGDDVAPGALAVPVVGGDTDPVRPAPGVGGRHVHDDRDRLMPTDFAALSPAEQVVALDRAGLDACSQQRVPPWCRDAMDTARAVDVGQRPSPAAPAVDDGRARRLRRRADARADHGGRRTAGRQRARGPDTLAGHALAQRRPASCRSGTTGDLHRPADVLAGAHPEPCTARRSIISSSWTPPRRWPNAKRRSAALRLAALRRRRQPPRHASQHGRPLGRPRPRHRAARAHGRGVPGGDAGGDRRRLRQRTDHNLERRVAEINPMVWDSGPVTTSS